MDHLPTKTHLSLLFGMVVFLHLWVFWRWRPEISKPPILSSFQERTPLHVTVLAGGARVDRENTEMKRSGVVQDRLSSPVSPIQVVDKPGAAPLKVLRPKEKPEKQAVDKSQERIQEQGWMPSPVSVAYLRVPSSVKLNYQIAGMYRGMSWSSGVGVFDWSHQGDVYSLEFTFPHRSGRAKTQTSRGHLSLEEGLLPVRFGDRLQSERAVHFQRMDGVNLIRFSANVPSVELQPHAQDQLSILVQLAAIVSGRLVSGTPMNGLVSFQVATTQDASMWTFNVQSIADDPNLVYVDKMPVHHYDGRWELWLAAELNYLPTKWRVSLYNGDFYEYQQTQAVRVSEDQ